MVGIRGKKDDIDTKFIHGLCAILFERGVLKNVRDVYELERLFKGHDALSFEEFLLDEDMVSKKDLLAALAEYYKVQSIDVIGEFFDHQLLRMFPLEVMLQHFFIPYERDVDILFVVAAYPDDPELLEIIGKFVSYDIVFMVGLYNDINDQVKEFYDVSIEQADLEMFEDTRDEHENHDLEDAIDREEQE